MNARHPRDQNAFTCEDVVTRMYELLDEELSPTFAESMHAHLARCHRCTGELAHRRAFLRCLERAGQADRAPATLRVRIIDALRSETTHGPV